LQQDFLGVRDNMVRRFAGAGRLVVALTALALSSVVCVANPQAFLVQVRGKVLINHGQGFDVAEAQMPVRVGDRILVSEKSLAEVYYPAQECSITYTAPSVVVIRKSSPCSMGGKSARTNSVLGQSVGAAYAPSQSIVPVLIGLSQPTVGMAAFVYTSFIQERKPVSLP
jgi:hypothetical protein